MVEPQPDNRFLLSDEERESPSDIASSDVRETVLLIDLVRQSQDALIVRDLNGIIYDLNPAAEKLYGYRAEEVRGRNVHDLLQNRFPQGRDAYTAALVRDGYWAGLIVQQCRDGSEVTVSSRQTLRRGGDQTPELVLVSNRDITEREQAVRRLRRLFDSQVVGVIFWNLDTGLITDANETFLTMVGYTRDDVTAGWLDFRAMTPPEWTERNEREIAAIRREGSAITYEKEYFRKDGSRVPILIGGTRFEESGAEGFSYILDITERKAAEERQRFLTDLSEQTRTLLDPDAVAEETLRSISRFLRLSYCLYAAVDREKNTVTVRRQHSEGSERQQVGLPYEVSRLGSIADELGAGRTVINRDADSQVGDSGGAVMVPLLREGRWVGYFAAMTAADPVPRDWSLEEVALLEAVAERMWVSMESARLYHETRARAEREALLNRIGAGIREGLTPEAVEELAVSMLGNALNADHCSLMVFDLPRDSVAIARDWYRDGLRSCAGSYRPAEFGGDLGSRLTAGETFLMPDASSEAKERGFTAFFIVPLMEGTHLAGALMAAMAGGERNWTTEEILLAESVAGQLRSTVDAVRQQQRERTIAQQLQEALVPTVPETMPGLAIQAYYRAALQEAGVGGDFSDVFAVRQGALTCLVVADLSGKGLAAASQVATVRNMLRYALHGDDSLADAMTRLNQVLAEQGLLTGFATLFVGMYDHALGHLSYVNCGQEPGLLWRTATNRVEPLPPTGPVLGGFAEATFTETTVALATGDILVLFTDGMTEVGPSRKAFLEIAGMTALLEQCGTVVRTSAYPAAEASSSVATGLIAGVEIHAGGAANISDDIALLVAVVTPSM